MTEYPDPNDILSDLAQKIENISMPQTGKVSMPQSNKISGVQFNSDVELLQPAKIQYKFEVVTDTDNPNVGRAIYNPETKILTLYMHDGYIPNSINDDMVQKYLVQSRYSMAVTQIAMMSINPVEQRTCKNFTAQRDQVSNSPVSLSRKYDFDKPFEVPSCSSDKKIPEEYVCAYDQQQSTCPIYEPEQWITEKQYTSEKEKTDWKLESIRKGIGFKFYRVTSFNHETEEANVLFTSNVVEDPENAFILAEKNLNNSIDGLIDVLSVSVDNSQEIKLTYYEYAFPTTVNN